MKRKKLLLTIIICSIFLQINLAQNMNVHLTNGNTNLYDISVIKTLTFTGDTMNVNKTNLTTVYEFIDNIRKITFSDLVTSALKETDILTGNSDLLKVYPNPANTNVNISYTLDKPGFVDIKIFDLQGRFVKQFSKGMQQAGNYLQEWNRTDDNGNIVNNGTYICYVNIDSNILTKKVLIIE